MYPISLIHILRLRLLSSNIPTSISHLSLTVNLADSLANTLHPMQHCTGKLLSQKLLLHDAFYRLTKMPRGLTATRARIFFVHDCHDSTRSGVPNHVGAERRPIIIIYTIRSAFENEIALIAGQTNLIVNLCMTILKGGFPGKHFTISSRKTVKVGM